MKLLKPNWVHHDDKPIFSIDVHQGCLKFATGGQGLDSGRVVIWNLLPVLSEKSELDPKVPKVLCQMDQHLGCVNCVRWSQNGLLLASASDDKLIMIWRQSQGTSGVFGTGGIKKNPETWKCVYTLRGHAGDVLDLAWSPEDRYLASCSIDNTVIIWDAQSFPRIIATLKGHVGLVKGVSWDPVGKFLASQSDDRSIRIWKTSDWSCSSIIKEPFEECGGTTHILRLCWSPDGQYLVSAHAMNSGGPTAQIIDREGWKCDKDFVGHRKAVTCVRFNNAILSRKPTNKSQGKPQQHCCLAVGSRDRSLSVWMTALRRPMVVIHELFNDSILDLSWGTQKCVLMACSGDGTVACLQFTDEELGTRISDEYKDSIFQRMYGKNALKKSGLNNSQSNEIIESADLLNYAQSEIQPPKLPGLKGNIPPEPEPQPPHAVVFDNGNDDKASETAAMNVNAKVKAISKQSETRTADGKRRITPMFIPMNQEAADASSSSNNNNEMSSSSRASAVVISDDGPSTSASATATKALESKDFTNPNLDSRLIMSSQRKLAQPIPFDAEELRTFPLVQTNKPPLKPNGPTLHSGTAYQASTSGPKININAATKCEFYKAALDYRITVQNGNIKTSHGMLARILAYRLGANEMLWEQFFGSAVVNFNFCSKYAIFCCLDGSLRLLCMKTGCSMLPTITLSTAAIQCAFCPEGKRVGVITECGILRIWDIEKQRVLLAITCNEVLNKFGSVQQLTITDKAVPLVVFANGHAYSYSQNLRSWLVINTKDPIMHYCLNTTLPRELKKNYRLYPLLTTQTTTYTYASATQSTVENNTENWQAVAKIAFIENQIKLCEAIKSSEELKYWYSMLVYHLAACSTENRMRILLDDLLGAPSDDNEQRILDIPKHQLLENALDALKPHLRWQRIYAEYMELYKFIKSERNDKLFSGGRMGTSSKRTKHIHPFTDEDSTDNELMDFM